MASTVTTVVPESWTVADMLDHLGGIPPNRVHLVPTPGTATEKDVLEAKSRFGRICELVDGVLVEKTVGSYESILAGVLIHFFHVYLETRPLGVVLGADGPLRLLPNQVRIPDVSFIRWERFPGGRLPATPVFAVVPDLAVEVLSEGNTPAEMERKLRDYFQAGVRLVWYVDPQSRSVHVYTAPDRSSRVHEDQMLDGDEVLPGFQLSLHELFARAERGSSGEPMGPGEPNRS